MTGPDEIDISGAGPPSPAVLKICGAVSIVVMGVDFT
jgi:hypothetical protein